MKIHDYIGPNNVIFFNSSYSVLYFKRIIKYLKDLLEFNIDLVEDDLIKIFFYILFLFLDENLTEKNISKHNISLDETFFKGTFIELTNKYSSLLKPEDSKEILNYIDKYKNIMNIKILKLIDKTFQYIKEILSVHGETTDDLIKKMNDEVSDILNKLDKSNNKLLSNDLIQKIKEFYSKEEYLIFTNYISENDYINLKTIINKNFLKVMKGQYSFFEFNYNSNNDISSNTDIHQKNLDYYLAQRNKYYKRMKYSSLCEILKYDLNDEINIFLLSEYVSSGDFLNIQKLKNELENLNQKKIKGFIKDILNENEFYEHYFSILKYDIIKSFFTNHLTINENTNDFILLAEKSANSECFMNAYVNFMNKYNKKSDNYNGFKGLIIFKILQNGDRAYTMRHLKKIIINPVQFFFGKDIIYEVNIKTILKGYLMFILLDETEHFLRALDEGNNVRPQTPKEKEGGRMFIKYLFGVQSINHINLEQTNKIFNKEIWKNHEILKTIFNGQLEDVEEENINVFLSNYFKSSISFFNTRQKNGKKQAISI